MKKKVEEFLGGAIGLIIGIPVIILLLLSIPLSMITAIRYFHFNFWGALVFVIFASAIPIIGQIGFIIATVIGLVYLISAGFSWNEAAYPGYSTAIANDRRAALYDSCRYDERFNNMVTLSNRSRDDFCSCFATAISPLLTGQELAYQHRNNHPSDEFAQATTRIMGECQ